MKDIIERVEGIEMKDIIERVAAGTTTVEDAVILREVFGTLEQFFRFVAPSELYDFQKEYPREYSVLEEVFGLD